MGLGGSPTKKKLGPRSGCLEWRGGSSTPVWCFLVLFTNLQCGFGWVKVSMTIWVKV